MADVSPLTRRPTISRQTGPTYINSYALKGIRVYYTPPIPIPESVSLPFNWSLPQLNEHQYRVDLSMEKQVIDQANLRRQAIAGEATSPHDSLRGGITGGIPMIPYQNSTILTPVPAPNDTLTTGGDTQPVSESPTPIDKPLGEMSLRDFEGESDPFEVTALQAIDVYTELQSVLQPHQTSNTGTTVPSDVSSSVAPPSGYLSQSAPSQTLYTGSPGPLPPPGPVYETIGSRGSDVGVLVDVGGRPQEPLPAAGPVIQYPPLPSSSPLPPPPVPPKPTTRTGSHSPNTSHRPFAGVSVLPPIGQLPQQQAPPPYSSEPSSYAPPPKAYSLPDIRATLSLEEKENLSNISSMGFPPTRVARALKKYEGDNQKVFDFLFLVNEIEEKGYNGDSGETALLAHDEDIEKSLTYLEKVYQYKEVWPEAKIHEAYQQASGSWDDTIDILTQES